MCLAVVAITGVAEDVPAPAPAAKFGHAAPVEASAAAACARFCFFLSTAADSFLDDEATDFLGAGGAGGSELSSFRDTKQYEKLCGPLLLPSSTLLTFVLLMHFIDLPSFVLMCTLCDASFSSSFRGSFRRSRQPFSATSSQSSSASKLWRFRV